MGVAPLGAVEVAAAQGRANLSAAALAKEEARPYRSYGVSHR